MSVRFGHRTLTISNPRLPDFLYLPEQMATGFSSTDLFSSEIATDMQNRSEKKTAGIIKEIFLVICKKYKIASLSFHRVCFEGR